MSTPTATAPLRYQGSRGRYVDIAVRAADEHLGIGVEYQPHPAGVGAFIVRFVAHGAVDLKNFKHLTYREKAHFAIMGTAEQPTHEMIKGFRLPKVAIPAFKPAVQRHELAHFAAKFDVWVQIAAWVAAQVAQEGFTLTVEDLPTLIAGLAIPPPPPTTTVPVESVLEFPKLDAPQQQAAALALVKDPEPDEDEGEEEDGDEDGDGEDEEWLN